MDHYLFFKIKYMSRTEIKEAYQRVQAAAEVFAMALDREPYSNEDLQARLLGNSVLGETWTEAVMLGVPSRFVEDTVVAALKKRNVE